MCLGKLGGSSPYYKGHSWFGVVSSVREGTQGLMLAKQELCHQELHHISNLSCCFELSSSTGSKNSRLKIKMRSAMAKFTSTNRPWPSKKSAVRGGSQIPKAGQFQRVRAWSSLCLIFTQQEPDVSLSVISPWFLLSGPAFSGILKSPFSLLPLLLPISLLRNSLPSSAIETHLILSCAA